MIMPDNLSDWAVGLNKYSFGWSNGIYLIQNSILNFESFYLLAELFKQLTFFPNQLTTNDYVSIIDSTINDRLLLQ